MTDLTAALRFVHFAAAIALAGEFAFLLWVARPLREEAHAACRELRERCLRVAARWLAVLVVSGLAWFLVQAAVMSGAPLFDAGVLVAALGGTLFGQIAIARLLLAAALTATLALLRRNSARREPVLLGAGAALAAGLLASLAATGHGAAEQGADRVVHLCTDAVHLLAAGAWLGALPALAFVLRQGAGIWFEAQITRRFSTLGIAGVAALVLTGTVNAWYTVGDLPALFGTDYGLLLCAKLALFAVMLALAAANRLRWTPRLALAGESALALSRLRRNALAEIAIGLGVLGLVAALGVTVPALHAKILWPFSRTLEWSALDRPREVVPAAILFALAGAAIALFGASRRRLRTAAAGAALSLAVALGLAAFLVVPAHPTTYLESPVPYGVHSLLRGAPLYAEHCAGCHGAYGNGDGPLADALPRRPPNLPARLAVRREGDLLWSLQHGVPGTAMPAFRERVGEEQLWDLLNFLRAQANVDAGRRMDASVERWRPVTAPDFTFQVGRGAQESLVQQRGRSIVLLVFYSLPQSLPRLRELAAAKLSRLDRMGVRVVAVPLAGAPARGAQGVDPTMLAVPDAALVAAYAMFTRTIVGPPAAPPRHVEFLIDRQGYVRARSIEPGRDRWATVPELVRQAVLLNKERSRAAAPRRHAH
ncbi:MAG TPA: copper homeostasis membrane protein CopD [Burkholderiales bacterium]|nr:copper homeostasis membrane protein CopD [Burkholderiales bacterium]